MKTIKLKSDKPSAVFIQGLYNISIILTPDENRIYEAQIKLLEEFENDDRDNI